MDETANLGLPYIMAAQAQKHVTHNEAIRSLDTLVQLSVKDRDLTTLPAARLVTGCSGIWELTHSMALGAGIMTGFSAGSV